VCEFGVVVPCLQSFNYRHGKDRHFGLCDVIFVVLVCGVN